MYVRIKICGVTTPADARAAADLGADAIGLNFYVASPRGIAPQVAAAILRDLPPFVEPVGVFVNDSFRDIRQVLRKLGSIRTFQWHGAEHELSDPAPFQYLPAFSLRDHESLDSIRSYLDCCHERGHPPAGLLVDAHVAGQYGGTGQTAPWALLAELRLGLPLILAGGLTAENVAQAIRIVRPHAVDVASGVEDEPGRKSIEKMKRFIGAVREAGHRS